MQRFACEQCTEERAGVVSSHMNFVRFATRFSGLLLSLRTPCWEEVLRGARGFCSSGALVKLLCTASPCSFIRMHARFAVFAFHVFEYVAPLAERKNVRARPTVLARAR